MSDLVVVQEQRALTAGEIRAHVNRVQEVMQAVMQKETHYGVIPGSKKPSLYKPGAEVLCVTFRIAPSYRIEDLSNADSIRYRVTAVATHQITKDVLGEGVGEASSNEEKYKWRRSICQEEFDETQPDRRRIKYGKYQGKVEKTQQVRTEPADIANTVLKMAAKRAQVAMTLNVTAASDCFTQDIEDLPDSLRDLEESRAQDAGSGDVAMPRAKSERKDQPPAAAKKEANEQPAGPVSQGQISYLRKKITAAGIDETFVCNRFGITKLEDISAGDWDTQKADLLAMGQS